MLQNHSLDYDQNHSLDYDCTDTQNINNNTEECITF